MNVSVKVPQELYRRAAKVAAAENVSVDDFFAAALEGRILGFEWLKEQASNGSYQKFLRVLSKAPVVEPSEQDRL